MKVESSSKENYSQELYFFSDYKSAVIYWNCQIKKHDLLMKEEIDKLYIKKRTKSSSYFFKGNLIVNDLFNLQVINNLHFYLYTANISLFLGCISKRKGIGLDFNESNKDWFDKKT